MPILLKGTNKLSSSYRNRDIQKLLTLVVFIAVVAMFVINVPSSSARRLGTIPTAFTLTMMGSRRGKGGNLNRNLDDAPGVKSGRGQEITGVTLPENGKIRGWEFGEGRTIACANVNGKYLAVDGRCPRCAFDLYRGKLLVDTEVWGAEPRVACPTCSVTYSLKTGKFGPEYKATGLAGFVSTWARTATASNASKDVSAFVITKDQETGRVFCREV